MAARRRSRKPRAGDSAQGGQPRERKKADPEQLLSELGLHRFALWYLERYDSSAANLRQVLLRQLRRHGRELEPEAQARVRETIDALVEQFQRSGLVDDARYAEAIAHSLRQRGTSQRAVAFKLRSRGISETVIETALEQVDRDAGEEPELAAARALVRRKRLGPHRPAEQREDKRQKDLAALARAGFSYELARRALLDVPEA